MTASRRMRLTVTDYGSVVIRYWDDLRDSMVEREFSVPRLTGTAYVREGDRQVCDGLASMGRTLLCTAAQLPDVIRSEYRRMRRAERR